MNTISFTPQITNYSVAKQNKVTFKGIKPQTIAQPKQAENIINRLYQMFFVPFGEKVVKIKNGNSYTEKFVKNNKVRILKERRLFGLRPKAIIKDERKTKLRELKTFNKDKTVNLEYSDIYTPEHKVSVGFNNIKDEHTFGGMTIKYGDIKVDIDEQKRQCLIRDMENAIEQKFPESIEDLNNIAKQGKFEEHLHKFYKTPEVIASALLKSPKSLVEQIQRVPRSMPYGIQCLLEKLGK